MTTITGIPAHALLVHAIVVLAPLVALLEILCALWPAARRRLVWLVLLLATVNLALTPLTTEAGAWLYDQQSQPSPILQTHAERGGWMIYFSAGLLVVALALVVVHWLTSRSDKPRIAATVFVAVLALAGGGSFCFSNLWGGGSPGHALWGGGGGGG